MNSNDNIEVESAQVSLFSDRFERDEYYTGAGHLNILVNIRRDVAARIPIIVLTGESGCGKSVMGRMLAAEASSGCIPVYFDETVDSFEDVVATIADTVGVVVEDMSREGITAATEQIAASIAQRDDRLLLICDGAEGIYLATFERIRKLLDRINRAVVSMQLILIGRPMLLDNLMQLSLCNLEEVPEKRYVLAPLSFSETRSYMEFCKKKMPEADGEIFSAEVVDKIYQASEGNFRKIHRFAQECCKRHSQDASFWVLLENVEERKEPLDWGSRKERLSFLRPTRYSPRTLGFAGAVVAFGLVLLVFFLGDNEKATVQPVIEGDTVSLSEPLDTAAPEVVDEVTGEKETDQSGDNVQGAADESIEQSPLSDTPAVALAEVKDTAAASAELPTPLVKLLPENQEVIETQLGTEPETLVLSEDQQRVLDLLEEAEEAVEIARQSPDKPIAIEVVEAQDAIVGNSPPEPISESFTEENPVKEPVAEAVLVLRPARLKKLVAEDGKPGSVVLQQVASGDSGAASGAKAASVETPLLRGDKVKKKMMLADAQQAPVVVNTSPAKKTIEVQTLRVNVGNVPSAAQGAVAQAQDQSSLPITAESKKVPVFAQAILPGKTTVSTQDLYADRVAATKPWLSGLKDDKYTMQIMMLSSDTAQKDVDQILAKQDYRSMYVLERAAEPSGVFVFVGEYASMAEAEQAKLDLPESLKKNKPFVLSVPAAVLKVQ